MTKPALIAQITGEAYQHMLEWRNEIDSQLIQFQLDRDGEALVITFVPEFHMRRITELPELGTARAHTSSFGGGYEFCFLHSSAGWMLSVTNNTQRSFRFQGITPIPPLLIDDTTAISIAVRQFEDVRGLAPTGLMDDSNWDRTPTERATFPIGGEDFDKLVAWGWTRERLTEYQYGFIPLSVGCEIMVEHPASGTKNHLTKDVGW
jgi:hypothetical protein